MAHIHLQHVHRPRYLEPHPPTVTPRADPSPSPSPSPSDFSTQSFFLGLLTGLGICGLVLSFLYFVRQRHRRNLAQRHTTLTPDKFSYVMPGQMQGHHIITERVLGDDDGTRPPSPTSASGFGGHSTWGGSATDLLGSSAPNSPLPAAMRDARGRFHAPSAPSSEPGSPMTLTTPDRAFSPSAIFRASVQSASTGTGRSITRPFSSSTTLTAFSSSSFSKLVPDKDRLEKERELKERLGMRMRNTSVDELRIVNAGPAADLPPYSREDDPDPFKR